MTTDRELAAAVDAWVREGPTMIPNRVLESVRAQVPETGQQLRVTPVTRTGRRLGSLGLVAVLAAVVVLGAAAVLGGGASPAPAAVDPTASPAHATPTPAAVLPPGTHRTVVDGVTIQLQLPAGWTATEGGRAFIQRQAAPPDGSFIAFWRVTGVRRDPCDPATLETAAPSAALVGDALAAIAADDPGSTPEPVELGGHAGVYLEFAAPEDAACSPVEFTWWVDGAVRRWSIAKGEHNRAWILDVGGRPLIVNVGYLPGTPARDLAALDAVVASVRIEAGD